MSCWVLLLYANMLKSRKYSLITGGSRASLAHGKRGAWTYNEGLGQSPSEVQGQSPLSGDHSWIWYLVFIRSWPICPKICFCRTNNFVVRLGPWPPWPPGSAGLGDCTCMYVFIKSRYSDTQATDTQKHVPWYDSTNRNRYCSCGLVGTTLLNRLRHVMTLCCQWIDHLVRDADLAAVELVFNPSNCSGIRWLHIKLFSVIQV